MKDPLVKGHPLHAMATPLPIGATVLGVATDLVGLVVPAPAWRDVATLALAFAVVTGLGVALLGVWDYQAVPPEHPARHTGARHGWTNAVALLVLAASAILHWIDGTRLAAVGLGIVGLGLLAAGGWLGGTLVYRHGWRVVPAEHAEQIEAELRKRGQTEPIERAHQAARDYERDHALVP